MECCFLEFCAIFLFSFCLQGKGLFCVCDLVFDDKNEDKGSSPLPFNFCHICRAPKGKHIERSNQLEEFSNEHWDNRELNEIC